MRGGALLCLGLLLITVSVEAYLPPPYGGRLAVPLSEQPVSLEPALASREAELQIISLLHDSLYAIGADGRPQPHLVLPPQIAEDGKTWTFTLRPGVLAGGRPLGAAEAVASLRALKRGPNGYLLAPVRSIDLEGNSLLLQLHRPAPLLPWLLAAPAAGIVAGQTGSGPFRIQTRAPTSLLLRANPTHFAGRPFLDELRLQLFDRASSEMATFQIGNLQLSYQGTSVFGGRPRHASAELEGPQLTLVCLGVGRGKSYLADAQFRQALLLGIDRRRLGRLATSGRAEIADSPVPARLLKPAGRKAGFDRAAALRLLGRVAAQHPGLRRDSPGGRLKLSLLVDASRFEDTAAAGQLVADLDRLGISASIEARPAAEYQARLEEQRYELVLARLPAQVPLGPVMLAGALALAGERAAAARCLGGSGCGAREAAQFMKRLPLIPLVHAARRIFHDARLGGVRLSPQGLLSYADLHWIRRGP